MQTMFGSGIVLISTWTYDYYRQQSSAALLKRDAKQALMLSDNVEGNDNRKWMIPNWRKVVFLGALVIVGTVSTGVYGPGGWYAIDCVGC